MSKYKMNRKSPNKRKQKQLANRRALAKQFRNKYRYWRHQMTLDDIEAACLLIMRGEKTDLQPYKEYRPKFDYPYPMTGQVPMGGGEMLTYAAMAGSAAMAMGMGLSQTLKPRNEND